MSKEMAKCEGERKRGCFSLWSIKAFLAALFLLCQGMQSFPLFFFSSSPADRKMTILKYLSGDLH